MTNTSSQTKTPLSILEIVGANPEPATLSNAVLLIIDAQQEYVDGKLPLAGITESLAIGGKLLERARNAGTPVVHVLHRGGGPLFNPDSAVPSATFAKVTTSSICGPEQ